MIKKLYSYYKRYRSVRELALLWCRRVLGIEKQQNNITTLFYFLNSCIDVSKIPPTSDKDLRNLQLCDTELMRIFSDVCKKHGLNYWLYGGTLLGAVRHHGFIPWDDDTDISMPREDFEKAIDILPLELAKCGIETKVEDERCPLMRIGLGYRHYETGIWVDIFPVDSFYSTKSAGEIDSNEMKKISKKVRKYYENHKHSKHAVEEVETYKKKKLEKYKGVNYKVYYDNMEFPHHFPRLYDESEIYPLTTLPFEGLELSVPSQYDVFLTKMYGNYMSLPKSGVEHHGKRETGSVKTWSRSHNIDMNNVYEELKRVKI